MKIMLLGKNGQVGWELQRSLATLGDLIALDRRDRGGDLAIVRSTAEKVLAERPNVVVNAAAYTAVDRAESESAICRRVNTEAVSEIASACAEVGALFVHYSTDYVFNGSGSMPWHEGDTTDPLNVYGHTKRDGELRICNSGCRYLIFRTSWVYGLRGDNFAKTMLRLAQERETLSVISDQIGVPTGAELIADVSAHAIRYSLQRKDLSGIFHLAPIGETNWYEYARYCIENVRSREITTRLQPNSILPITTAEYKAKAIRPLNSRLNVDKIKNVFDLELPEWTQGIDRLLKTLY